MDRHFVDLRDGRAREAQEMRTCRSCGHRFEFTPGERRYFAEHGLVPPQRCPPCRAEARAAREQAARG